MRTGDRRIDTCRLLVGPNIFFWFSFSSSMWVVLKANSKSGNEVRIPNPAWNEPGIESFLFLFFFFFPVTVADSTLTY